MRRSSPISAWSWSPFDHANADGSGQSGCGAGGDQRRGRGRGGAAPRLLPQPDRHRLHRRSMGRDRRRLCGERHLPDHRSAPIRASATGMEEDAAGMRAVLAAVPEAFIAYSCDKNFGQYRDRVGAFYILAQDAERARHRVLQRQCAGARVLVDAARSWRRGGADHPARSRHDRAVAGRARPDARADAAGARCAGARRARRGGST